MTVLLSAGSATLLATLTVIGVSRDLDPTLVYVSFACWLLVVLAVARMWRLVEYNAPIARVYAIKRALCTLTWLSNGCI